MVTYSNYVIRIYFIVISIWQNDIIRFFPRCHDLTNLRLLVSLTVSDNGLMTLQWINDLKGTKNLLSGKLTSWEHLQAVRSWEAPDEKGNISASIGITTQTLPRRGVGQNCRWNLPP